MTVYRQPLRMIYINITNSPKSQIEFFRKTCVNDKHSQIKVVYFRLYARFEMFPL